MVLADAPFGDSETCAGPHEHCDPGGSGFKKIDCCPGSKCYRQEPAGEGGSYICLGSYQLAIEDEHRFPVHRAARQLVSRKAVARVDLSSGLSGVAGRWGPVLCAVVASYARKECLARQTEGCVGSLGYFQRLLRSLEFPGFSPPCAFSGGRSWRSRRSRPARTLSRRKNATWRASSAAALHVVASIVSFTPAAAAMLQAFLVLAPRRRA